MTKQETNGFAQKLSNRLASLRMDKESYFECALLVLLFGGALYALFNLG